MGNLRDWIPLADVLKTITDSEWTWWRNSECKYINIRVDTRDEMRCLIQNRNGEPITLDELKYQYLPATPPTE